MKRILFIMCAIALMACNKQSNATTVHEFQNDNVSLKANEKATKAPIIKMRTPDGKSVVSSDFKGKLAYIDIWATWCPPCRGELPHMKALYEHYKDNDQIAIISISVDEDADAWKKMITEQKMEWQQYISNGSDVETLANGYELRSIPRFLIIGADGSLINYDAPRPSNEDLIPFLDNLLEK